jgi:hypothetical protein
MDAETIKTLRAELQALIQAQIPRPFYIKRVQYHTKTEEGKPMRPLFGAEISMYGPKEEVITILAINIPFDEAFYDQHHAFLPEKTLVLVDKKRPEDAALATKIGQNLKKFTGQEFEIRWVEFVQRMVEW